MGHQTATNTTDRQTAIRWMLRDLQALEYMLAHDMFERGITRIGAEQEMFIVDGSWQPAPRALSMLAEIADGHFTTEVGAFNLELNLDPQVFSGTCLSTMEAQLDQFLTVARAIAAAAGLNIVLTGILPTIRKGDLSLDNMVQNPRYLALNDALMSLRGEAYELHIKGMDELRVRQDSVMAEACNASFQVHLQVSARRVRQHVQRVPAAGRTRPRVRNELTCALRQAAVGRDSHRSVRAIGRHPPPRPPHAATAAPASRSAPTGSTSRSPSSTRRTSPASDPYSRRSYDDPFAELAEGRVPTLAALRMHTGTVWRWNRGCYGITDGVPHLRIENRVLPSGPSVADEIANAAMWLGLMKAVGARHPEVNRMMPFEAARANFVSAARQGLASHQVWIDGSEHSATSLALDVLLPLADDGLASTGARRRRPHPLSRCHRAPGSVGQHGVTMDPRLARRDAQPGHRRAATQQCDCGDGQPPSAAAYPLPTGRRRASMRVATGGTTS